MTIVFRWRLWNYCRGDKRYGTIQNFPIYKLEHDTSYKGLWTVDFTLHEF